MQKNILYKFTFIALLLIFSMCKEEEYNVPQASTQTDFSFTYEVVQVDGVANYKVTIQNNSVQATSYAWDFGNGQTSTEQNPVVYYSQEGDYVIKLTVTSDSDLHYNVLVKTKSLRVIFKEVVFQEKFNSLDYETNFPLPGWTILDEDGDGENWYCNYFADDLNGYLLSRSYLDPEVLTPDNWIITPEIDLSAIETGNEIFLNYLVCPTANTPMYRTEHYSILISTTGIAKTDFIQIFDETLTEEMVNWEYVLREIDLSIYAGQKVYIAVRHWNSTDKDRISIDDIEVFWKF